MRTSSGNPTIAGMDGASTIEQASAADPVRVYLGAAPRMIGAIIRDVLEGQSGIRIVESGTGRPAPDYDVLILSSTGEADEPGSADAAGPESGIVLVERSGCSASVFRRVGEDFALDTKLPLSLAEAIRHAAAMT